MHRLPYQSTRIIELSHQLTGRLTGLLFADQGAEVYLQQASNTPLDDYLNRGKIALPADSLIDHSSADIIIVDGDRAIDLLPHQILMRITAALPGDEDYGDLADDCSDDLLNALLGFFTDMGTSARYLGRPVIYTPLPLCSIYAGVNGAIALAASLLDRESCGLGRTIIVSRMASGLSAIGALCLTSEGIPEHLAPTVVGGLPEGLSPETFKQIAVEAAKNPAKQLWLEQRFTPLASPYWAADKRLILPMTAPNRRLTRKMLQHLGLWKQALAAGMADVSCYQPQSQAYLGRNLADSMALNFTMTSLLADMLEQAFAQRTAAEWEQEFCSIGLPCVAMQNWEEWKKDSKAKHAGIFTEVKGCEKLQIGRSSWLSSAKPYPPLKACRQEAKIPARKIALPALTGAASVRLPLTGYIVLDFCNVVAGPAAGRMMAELGAIVYQIVPAIPEHSPTIVVTWTGEFGTGKKSIIIDAKTDQGLEVIKNLVKKADIILANMLDEQMKSLGIDQQSLKSINPKAIGVQLSAYRGQFLGERHGYPGYDPALQGSTGIMTRFGREECPSFHGVASTVDYLCGYLAVWAAVSALAAREHRKDGQGDWAETSLAAAATLAQLTLQYATEPASARGPFATGMTLGERVYSLANGWIFAQGKQDLSKELAEKNVDEALDYLRKQGIKAVPIQTCRQLANRHRDKPSKTIRFQQREKDGWKNEGFAPTWFAFDGVPSDRLNAASRIGADGAAILAALNYSQQQIEALLANKIVGQTEFG
ncbi:Formyl-coenzyme A transferase [Legionella massiliensis]|uniref:Formyl-coenzyme A transferase n=1 Tax=Legionella massiliensis TaxID=1034943 RepID=A0A078KZY2_9GAMM|nr:CoA transferase [Legionella massiliensis]CDZ77363.1 Formyl-coenzyme A transferase [Legionella massiliensis]CEE13101.1 Formyl-coenzyme A transferase [Legionella massiliensis]